SIASLNAELERSIALAHAQLGEKELLIRETNHRVKNHLAQIVSLIDLSGNADPVSALKAIKSRILGYALLYEKLSYREGDAEELDLAAYARDLLGALVELTPSPVQVDVSFDAEPIRESVRKCTTLGLVLAELVTNSIKHASSGSGSMALSVSLRSAGEGRVRLDYSDDGPGFDWAAARDASAGKGIGMILIDTMLAQYDGNIQYSREGGSRFLIVM
ncbi:MAG TPA: histidine kinase dimerization/phosphoacceptor domain -containing protein, partial [Spirochaetales bacterium]|nr:histidine kinase dimerization/phosphoacceptor domain -containing protein [Spirochaetales bacterium]